MKGSPPLPDPSTAEAALELGNSLLLAGRAAEAVRAYERAVALEPGNARAHNNLAVAWAEQRRFEPAIAGYEQALQLDPRYAEAHYNLGNALRELARREEALASYDRAGALRPDYPEAHNNLGLSLELQGCLDEARMHFDRALELAPGFASAHANRAQLRLLQGDFRNGWPEYEWRWRLPGVSLPPIEVRPWDGTSPAGRSVLARAEQGFGDTIQFVRLARLLKEAGARVVLECQPALTRLLANAPGVDAVVARGDPLPRCDVQIPLASLPHVLGIFDLDSVSRHVPYLKADGEIVAKWRHALAPDEGLRVGIAWKGNPRHPQDCHRSIPVERFATLAEVPGVKLFSLQVGEPTPSWLRELASGAQGPPGFEETAAIVANLDLVVSCDTATAHLAGALGRPVWIALPPVPDFRWLLHRDGSPWYPSARLFRQKRLGDWEELFARMADALAARASAGNA